MRAVFGVVSLLIVVAVIGMVATRQLKASGRAVGTTSEQVTSPAAPLRGDATPATAGTVREQSQQLQQRARDDVSRALEQGAAARKAEADK